MAAKVDAVSLVVYGFGDATNLGFLFDNGDTGAALSEKLPGCRKSCRACTNDEKVLSGIHEWYCSQSVCVSSPAVRRTD